MRVSAERLDGPRQDERGLRPRASGGRHDHARHIRGGARFVALHRGSVGQARDDARGQEGGGGHGDEADHRRAPARRGAMGRGIEDLIFAVPRGRLLRSPDRFSHLCHPWTPSSSMDLGAFFRHAL